MIFSISLTSCSVSSEPAEKKGYTSFYTCVINNKNGDSTIILSGNLDSSSANSEKLLNIYKKILVSKSILESVIDYLDNKSLTLSQMQEMVKAEIVDNTEMIKVSVTAETPTDAYSIANAHSKTAPALFAQIIDGANMKIVDFPVLPTEKK